MKFDEAVRVLSRRNEWFAAEIWRLGQASRVCHVLRVDYKQGLNGAYYSGSIHDLGSCGPGSIPGAPNETELGVVK